jgi:hypothetical protein
LNQSPLGYELTWPPHITKIYRPPVCRSQHLGRTRNPAQQKRLGAKET